MEDLINVWVKYENFRTTTVEASPSTNVDTFIKKSKTDLQLEPSAIRLELYTWEGTESLPVADLLGKYLDGHSDTKPLRIRSIPPSSAAAPAPSVHKQWYVNSTLYPDLRGRYYFADQSLQNQGLIENVIEGHFLRMYGPRSSGKSSRVYQAMEQLETKGYECLYVTLEGCLFTSDHVFWETFGKKMEHNKLPVPITSSTTFQTAFTKNSNKKKRWERPVILFIDEFDPLHDNGCETACSSVLSAIRGIKTTRNQTVIHSIVVIGTFAILELNQTLLSLSPFTGTENFRVASFTVEQVQTLFKEYSTDYHITIELEVVENIYDLTCGHAGLVCLCGRAIHQELYPKFGATGTLTFDTWARFASNDLLRKVPSYATFSRLVNTLTSGKHNDAVDCLRANFLGVFDEYVQIPDVQIAECKLAKFLAAQGVLLSDPKNELGSFKMISPLVDTLMRRTVIPALYPSDPLKPVPTCGDIIFIPDIMKEALRFFDKELIRLAPKRSFKTAGRLPVNGSTDQKVPRESVYDQELGRVLASWLSKQERYSVTGQWHTETATRSGDLKGKHKYLDLVISKEGAPTIILQLLATCTEAVVKEHLDRANKYKDRLFAYASWVIHFTREDNYLNHAFWPLESTLQKGINMLHIWHNEDFNDVQMSGLWKDVHGNTRKIEKVHVQSRC